MSQLSIAVLAGGLGLRLKPVTEHVPKGLVPVAGRPFLAYQLERFRAHGISHVVLCVGHLGEMIQAEFGNGSAYGLKIDYSFDGEKLLGTGGALRKALPLLGSSFFVIYGDSFLRIDYQDVAKKFACSGKPGLMTVFRNEGRWDTSNVEFDEGRISVYDKDSPRPSMHYIDYGLSILSAAVIEELPADQPADLAQVLAQLAVRKELAAYEATERFYEIGSATGLREFEEFVNLSRGKGSL